MLILISCLLFFITALVLIGLRVFQPEARYTWLIAAVGGMLGLVSIFLWRLQLPFNFVLSGWSSLEVLNTPIQFRADEISFAFALSIGALTLAILLTAVSQPVFVNTLTWANILILGGVGILLITSGNPLTLLLLWALLDLFELLIQISTSNNSSLSEKIVFSFSMRMIGSGLFIWAGMLSIADINSFSFDGMSARSGIFIVLASALRLGVIPLRLPYTPSDEQIPYGFGTALQLISVLSSLIILRHVPSEISTSTFSYFLLAIVLIIGLYAGWMWLRSPDEFIGRPYWIIGISTLAITSALTGNTLGVIAWGAALILVGGSMFLFTVQIPWLNRITLVGAFSLSTLPFSLTASTWLGNLGFFIPFVIILQALMMSGFIRHALRSSSRAIFNEQQSWMRAIYPAGIILLVVIQIILGLMSWDSIQLGGWIQALIASFLTFSLLWAGQRFRIFKPIRSQSGIATESQNSNAYQNAWTIYRFFGRIDQIITQTLEGEGGIMWTLLFLVLFASLILQAAP